MFELLKQAFTSAPVPNRPIIMETEASDYALGAMLLIQMELGDVHPVALVLYVKIGE